jgi:hypothetical protein
MKKLNQITLISLLLILASCHKGFKKGGTQDTQSLNEYEVIKNKPLAMPPSFDSIMAPNGAKIQTEPTNTDLFGKTTSAPIAKEKPKNPASDLKTKSKADDSFLDKLDKSEGKK